jgi:hypothetical protein
MKLILHIMLKDLRRHWREVALFAAVMAGWAWHTTHPSASGWLGQGVAGGVFIALPFVLWFFIVVRVVQGECLVGDREFWQTRPYRWWQLLAAKGIFLVVCLNGPFLAEQVYLLLAAGLPFRAGWILGLLWLQIGFAVIGILPVAALSAVTENLAQCIFALFGLWILVMMMTALPWGDLPVTLSGAEGIGTLLGVVIMVPLLAFSLVFQFARRRVWLSRLVLVGAVLAFPTFLPLSASQWVRSIAYPSQPAQPAALLHLAITGTGADGGREHTRRDRFGFTSTIGIPLTASFIAPDAVVVIEGSRFVLSGDDGWHWVTPWLKENIDLAEDNPNTKLSFDLPSEVADQFVTKHATAKVEVALADFRLTAPLRVETAADRFDLADIGVCSWRRRWFEENALRELDCVAPLRLPDVTVARVQSGEATCPAETGEPPLPAGHYATGLEIESERTPADFDPSPIHQVGFQFGEWKPAIPSILNRNQNRSGGLCPGTPVTIRTGTFTGRMRITFDLGGLGTETLINQEDESVTFMPRFK